MNGGALEIPFGPRQFTIRHSQFIIYNGVSLLDRVRKRLLVSGVKIHLREDKTMRRITGISVSLALCLLASLPLAADQKTGAPATARYGDPTGTARNFEDSLYGVVKTVDSNQMLLAKTIFGIDQTFKFEKKTKFLRDDKPSTWDALKPGDQVWVNIRRDKKTGDVFAKKVVSSGLVAPVE
jgi:hypothetical protein